MKNVPHPDASGFYLHRIPRTVLIVAGVALAYYATGLFLLVLGAPPNGAVTTVWLPSGITVAAFLRFGGWAALGSFLGSFALDLHNGTPVPAGVLVAVANAGSEYLCYRLVSPVAEGLRRLEKNSVVRLLVAATLASFLSAAIGVTAYLMFRVIPASLYLSIFLTWFGSTAVGILLIAPFLTSALDRTALNGGGERPEYAAALALLAGAAFLWQGPTLPHTAHEPVVLGVIVILLWIAFRFPSAAMPPAISTFAVAAVVGAVVRLQNEPPEGAFIAIFSLQLMLGGLSVVGYVLASTASEQRRSAEKLRLAARVYQTTSEGIMVTTAEGAIVDVNGAFERITGYSLAEASGRHPSFLKSERHPPEFFRTQAEVLQRTGEWQGEVWYRRADGEVFPAWLSLTAVRDGNRNAEEYVGILSDITELREVQTKLVESARHAGMAEIATNVLHNVGNVLNSVNVSATRLVALLKGSKAEGLAKATGLLQDHASDLTEFLQHDPKGKLLPDYLQKLSLALTVEQRELIGEAERIARSVDHIKEIVATQQSYAGASPLVETVQLPDLLEDALRMNAESLARHEVTVRKEFGAVPEVVLDKARVMMILVNLIRNAKDAMAAVTDRPQILTLRLDCAERGGERTLLIEVQDVGMGIAPEHLTRIFAHGFTTKKDGHGFGLHSCALAAAEMGGTLTAWSDGPGKGSTFALEIPVRFSPPSLGGRGLGGG